MELAILGIEVGKIATGGVAVVIAGIIVTILRKRGWTNAVKMFSRKASVVLTEIGEACFATADAFGVLDQAIKDNEHLAENSVKDLIKEYFYFTADRGGNYFATEGKNDDKMGKHEREARINAIKETKRRMLLEYRFS